MQTTVGEGGKEGARLPRVSQKVAPLFSDQRNGYDAYPLDVWETNHSLVLRYVFFFKFV